MRSFAEYGPEEAPTPDQAEWYKKYFLATIVALNNNPIPMADNSDDLYEFCDTLYTALVSDGKDKALKIGDYVFAYVNTSANRALFTVDSATFFDASTRENRVDGFEPINPF